MNKPELKKLIKETLTEVQDALTNDPYDLSDKQLIDAVVVVRDTLYRAYKMGSPDFTKKTLFDSVMSLNKALKKYGK